MKLILFAVHDKKLEAFMAPHPCLTKGEAIRNFSDTVNDPKSRLNKHPGDYDLYELGSWDDTSGAYTDKPNTPVITALECLKENPVTDIRQA